MCVCHSECVSGVHSSKLKGCAACAWLMRGLSGSDLTEQSSFIGHALGQPMSQ